MGRKKIIPTLCLLVFCNWCFADFTIGFIPDTQNLSETDEGGQLITEMNQFFVDNKEKLNVIFVASLGDMAQGYPRNDDWDDMVVAGNKGRVAIVTVPHWKVERVLHTDQLNNDYPKNAWGKPSWWVKSTRISPDQQYVAYGVSSGSAFTWKRDGILIKELPIHTYVEAVSFSPNGKVMVVGGNDQDTWTEYEQPQRFYSVPDFDLIMEFVTPGENCEYIDWSPDSKYMVQPSTSGNIMLFEANWNLTGE